MTRAQRGVHARAAWSVSAGPTPAGAAHLCVAGAQNGLAHGAFVFDVPPPAVDRAPEVSTDASKQRSQSPGCDTGVDHFAVLRMTARD